MKKIFSKKNVIAFLTLISVLMISAVAFAEGEDGETVVSMYHATFWALVPPIVAIGLALITKEVYSSLFVGIVLGGASFCKFCTGSNVG